MSEGKIVVAVDIGTSKIVTLITKIDDLVNVLGVSEVAASGIRKGQIVDMLVLRRAIAEIAKQKETYEGLSKEQSTTELDQLIKVMGQAVHILNALAQSFQNEIGANIRSMESFK